MCVLLLRGQGEVRGVAEERGGREVDGGARGRVVEGQNGSWCFASDGGLGGGKYVNESVCANVDSWSL